MAIRITLTSVLVDDQEKARRFYTEVLGFVTKRDMPLGDLKWLTVVSPAGAEGVELLLEPNENPAGKAFQRALFEQGIPLTSFAVDDLQAEYERLVGLGVRFVAPPTRAEWGADAMFDDTCGNLINLHEEPAP